MEPWRRAPNYAGGPSVLNTRTLATGHRRLAELLRPAQAVLDVGCPFHGPRMVEDGALTEVERAAAEADHRDWVARARSRRCCTWLLWKACDRRRFSREGEMLVLESLVAAIV